MLRYLKILATIGWTTMTTIGIFTMLYFTWLLYADINVYFYIVAAIVCIAGVVLDVYIRLSYFEVLNAS